MSDESKPFTVTDRRHFTHDGEVRPSDEESARDAPPAAAQGAEQAPSAPPPSMPSVGSDSISFLEFLVSLGAQGAGLLMEEDPSTADDRAAGVRHFIGLLEMLVDKTEGRRTPEEDQMLSQLLFELRTGYLARFKAS